jgi:hypothetical protein
VTSILVGVVDLDPAATGPGPGGFLAIPFMAMAGVADQVGDRPSIAVVDDIVVIVGDDEEVVFLGNGDDLAQDALR